MKVTEERGGVNFLGGSQFLHPFLSRSASRVRPLRREQGGRPRLAELGRPLCAPAAAPTRLPSNSMYDTHTNCRLSDGQPFHCLIVGYNTTRVVAIAWRSPWHVAGARWRDVGWRCGGGAVAALSRRLMADAAPCTVQPAELPGTLLRQGRQGRTPGVLARICHGSEMFVSTT